MGSEKLRIAVMGAGAVGGYFGAKLSAAGQEVSFIARGRHLEAMRRKGLRVKSIDGDLHIRSLFTEEPGDVGLADLVLLCVKSYDTEDAARKLAPVVGEETMILSLQNGVDNADKIAARWGRDRTLAGVVYLGALVAAPGTVEHSAGGRIVLGHLDEQSGESAKRVERLFLDAQVPCAVSSEIRKVMWAKLVWNAPFCALSCLARATVTEIIESDSLRELAVDCMEEVREAARSTGIDLAASIVEETFKFSRGLGDFKPSMLQDLEGKKPLEYEALNGVVADALRRAGKKAPVNEIFYAALKFFDDKIRGVAIAKA